MSPAFIAAEMALFK